MFNHISKCVFFVIVISETVKATSEISDKRLCANVDCSEPISYAKSLLRYNSPHEKILSFGPNQDVTIYSKSAGKNMDLWGAKIKGKRGYVPKIYMRETKILIKNPEFEVDTELLQQNETVEKSEAHKSTPRPDPVQAAYEVVDGTTIYMDEAITPTTPDNSVKPTVTPDVNRQTKPLDEPEKVETPSGENFHDVEKKEDAKPDVEDSIVGNIISGLSDFLSKTAEEQDDDDDEDGDGDENEEDEPDDGEIEVEDDDKEQIQKDSVNDSPQNSFDSTQVDPDAEISAQETISNMTQEPNSEPLQQNSDTILEVSPDSIQLPNTDSEEKDQKVPIDETGAETKADVIEETKEPSNYSNNFDSQPVVPDNSDENDKPIVESVNKSDMISEATNIEVEQQNTATNPIENTAQNETPIKTDAVDQLPIADLNNNDNGATNSAESTVQNEMPYKIDTNDQLPTANLNNNQQIDTSSSEILESTPSETNFVPENVPTTESTIHHDAPEDFFVENVTSDPGRAHSNEDSHEELYKNTLDVNNNVSPDDNEKSLDLQTESQTENVLENSDQITLEPTQKLDVVNDVVFESNVNANASENTNEKTIDEVDTEVTDESAKTGAHHDDIKRDDNNEETTEAPMGKGEIVDPANKNEEELDGNSESSGIFTSMYDRIFGNPKTNRAEEIDEIQKDLNNENLQSDFSTPPVQENFEESSNNKLMEDLINSKHQNFLVVTAITVLLFLLGYMFIDQNRKEAPLIAKINKLEKELLVKIKECADLTEKFSGNEGSFELEEASTELVHSLREELENSKTIQAALEEQVQTLEKELENSTEVGLELNRMLSEILNSQNVSETLITNIEQLQKQLLEQQGVINSLNESLTVKNTENHELNLELDISNKKVIDLQAELDKMVLNLLKMEEEKEQQQNSLETEIVALKEQITKCDIESKLQVTNLTDELNSLRNKLGDVEKQLEIKTNEFNLLKESAREWNSVENKSETLKSLLEVNSIKAELQQVRHDNQILNEHLHREQEMKGAYEKQIEITMKEVQNLKAKYDEADKQKLEAQTKLEVLSTYFSEREAELQKELSKQEKMWTEKQGEANSTIERIKYMQEELQNCKAHNEALKQEIVSQEVELKSQITVLEKKAHENWLMARQAERRLEDAKQEAAQLRNRLTLRERTLNDDKVQNRVQTPLERDGDMSASPLHMNVESPASPPLLFGTQNHLTTSPPLPGLPPPFLPPPPGVPFMSNPLYSVPPFMPPHLPFPSDHRPAPLGRLSSPPPLNSRYSPDSRAYSPYDRNSPSPPYDSEYSPSSPNSPFRTYTHYNNRIDDRKEYIRPPPIRKSRNTKVSGTLSSGSGNSNESLEKINRHTSSKI